MSISNEVCNMITVMQVIKQKQTPLFNHLLKLNVIAFILNNAIVKCGNNTSFTALTYLDTGQITPYMHNTAALLLV